MTGTSTAIGLRLEGFHHDKHEDDILIQAGLEDFCMLGMVILQHLHIYHDASLKLDPGPGGVSQAFFFEGQGPPLPRGHFLGALLRFGFLYLRFVPWTSLYQLVAKAAGLADSLH